MNRNFLAKIATFMVALATFACAEGGDFEFDSNEIASIEGWIKENKPYLTKQDSGLYVKYYKVDETAQKPKYTKDDFVQVRFMSKSLDGNYLFNMYAPIARQIGRYSYYTDYSQPQLVWMDNADFQLTIAQNKVLQNMNLGDSVELVATSNLLNDGVLSSTLPPAGFYGNYNYSQRPSYIAMKLVNVIDNINLYERSLVQKYALDHLGLQPADSVKDVSLMYMKIIVDSDGKKVEDNEKNIPVEYTGSFVNNFVFDTNIESVAEQNNIYDEDKNYTYSNISLNSTESGYVKGFETAIRNMKYGQTAIAVFTSSLGYGAVGESSSLTPITPYSPLVFKITILDLDEDE